MKRQSRRVSSVSQLENQFLKEQLAQAQMRIKELDDQPRSITSAPSQQPDSTSTSHPSRELEKSHRWQRLLDIATPFVTFLVISMMTVAYYAVIIGVSISIDWLKNQAWHEVIESNDFLRSIAQFLQTTLILLTLVMGFVLEVLSVGELLGFGLRHHRQKRPRASWIMRRKKPYTEKSDTDEK